MFLWELKNGIISTTLRELCDIKNPPTMASTSSATKSFITRCLSLSKAASKKHHNFITSSPRKIPPTVASTSSITNSFITRCLSLLKAVLIPPCDFDSAQSPYYLLLHSVPEPVEGTFSLLISVPEPVEGTFLFLPVFSTPLNHRIIYYYTRCLSLSKAHSHFSSRCLSLSKAHYFYCIKNPCNL